MGVSMIDGRIVVDWGQYFNQCTTYRGEEVLEKYKRILVALGILSFQKKSNWAVVSFSMFVNPSALSSQRLFFTRKHDAIEYAKLSGWDIDEVFQYSDQIISGSELKEA